MHLDLLLLMMDNSQQWCRGKSLKRIRRNITKRRSVLLMSSFRCSLIWIRIRISSSPIEGVSRISQASLFNKDLKMVYRDNQLTIVPSAPIKAVEASSTRCLIQTIRHAISKSEVWAMQIFVSNSNRTTIALQVGLWLTMCKMSRLENLLTSS